MILKEFYTQKKGVITALVNEKRKPEEQISIGLFNDLVFKSKSKVKFPLIMFKYNHVKWNTSSENEYKADVDFSVFVVLNTDFENDYLESFDLAKQIDKAILLHPTKTELIENNEALEKGETSAQLITNSAFKIKECQATVEDDNWEKNEFFIWEINYKTTLIEKEYKKRYTMVTNGSFSKANLKNEKRKEKVKESLRELGYDLNDYYEKEKDGKKLLIFKEVKETLNVNNKKINLN